MKELDHGLKKILTASLSFLILMGFSMDVHAQWVAVASPEVSGSWGLNRVHVLPNGNGWAVGVDAANKRGVILKSQNGVWSVVDPPKVSSDWELDSFAGTLEFTADGQSESISNVWAVGVDF